MVARWGWTRSGTGDADGELPRPRSAVCIGDGEQESAAAGRGVGGEAHQFTRGATEDGFAAGDTGDRELGNLGETGGVAAEVDVRRGFAFRDVSMGDALEVEILLQAGVSMEWTGGSEVRLRSDHLDTPDL